MGMAYENQRVIFNQILKKYLAYVELYRDVNHGSIEGVTPFYQFYWRFVYYSKYNNPKSVESRYY